MKILIYGINFAPEPVGVGRYTGEMAEYLAEAGHDVRVITALPYYPEWKVAPGYKPWAYTTDTLGKIKIWRAPLWVPFRPGGRKRVLHLLSFAVTSLPLLVLQWIWRPDVVWMAAPAFVCAPAALVTAKVTGAKSWIHVQDFEIDIAFGMGMVSGKRWFKFVSTCERWLLRAFDRLSTISHAMMGVAERKGVDRCKMLLAPNWVDPDAIRPLQARSKYRDEVGLPDDAFEALYSGTLGLKHGVEMLLDVAKRVLEYPEIQIVICGDGPEREALVARGAEMKNVHFLPLQPLERLGELLGMADVHLLPQRAGAADLVMPSKLAGMLSSGRPVIAMGETNGEVFKVIHERCGIVVGQERSDEFAKALVDLMSKTQIRVASGRRARDIAESELATASVLARITAGMEAICHDKNQRSIPAASSNS